MGKNELLQQIGRRLALAGFWLPLWLGFRGTCAGAMAITTLIAISALLLSR